MKPTSEMVHGLRAGLAVCAARPADVVELLYAREIEREVTPVLAGLRKTRAAIRAVPPKELERIARSPQHEGLVVFAKERAWLSAKELAERLTKRKSVAVALDRVRNSYNIGAIARGAAFFGVDAMLLGAPAPHPGLDGNAVRVAEGGVENLALSRTTDLADTLARMKERGIEIVGTDGQSPNDVRSAKLAGPLVVVLGNEREGLAPRVRAVCSRLVSIRGSGAVESLNVAVAAGVIFSRVGS